VNFDVTLEDDLARRDFTINAMAQSVGGELIDLFGGREDLAARVIRSVGEAGQRFAEDPLRILRAARFASQLDFDIEENTLCAMQQHVAELTTVAIQRCSKELDLLLMSENPSKGLRVLKQTGVLTLLLPEIALQDATLFGETLSAVSVSDPTVEARWGALLAGVAIPFTKNAPLQSADATAVQATIHAGLISKIGTYLRWPKARIKEIRSTSNPAL
jgi:tRNA nucleotidyltransferase/poly(A) polymerase